MKEIYVWPMLQTDLSISQEMGAWARHTLLRPTKASLENKEDINYKEENRQVQGKTIFQDGVVLRSC